MRLLQLICLCLGLLLDVVAQPPQNLNARFTVFNSLVLENYFLQKIFNPLNMETGIKELIPSHQEKLFIESKASQTFYLNLSPQQFVQIKILKGDFNLEVDVFDSKGLLVTHLISTQDGNITLSWLSEVGGKYHIRISSLEPNLVKEFSLNVLLPRQINAVDKDFVKYSLLFAEGENLFSARNQKSFELALEKYQTAFDGWRRLKNYSEAAESAGRMGRIFLIWGDNKKALYYFRTAFALSQSDSKLALQLSFLNLIGRSLIYLGEISEAKMISEKVIADSQNKSRESEGDEFLIEQGFANLNLGEILYSEGNLQKALDKFKISVQKFNEVENRPGQAFAYLYSGYALSDLGYLEEARSFYQKALVLLEDTFDSKSKALVLTALGGNYSFRGEQQKALKFHNDALLFFQQLGDVQSEGVTLNGIARAYGELNEPLISYEIYKQSVNLFKVNKNNDFESTTLLSLGQNCQVLGRVDEALLYYQQSFNLSKLLGKRRIAAYALSFIATILDSQGKSPDAIQELKKSLSIFESGRDRRGQAETYNSIGDIYYKNGKKLKALTAYRNALTISRTIEDKKLEAHSLFSIALLTRSMNRLEESLKNIEKAVQIIESLRVFIANEVLRMSYFSTAGKYYNFYINLLMQLNKSRQDERYEILAWQASEKVRSRVLLESLTLNKVKVKQTKDSNLSLREETLTRLINEKINFHSNLIGQNKSINEINKSAQEMRKLFIDFEEVQIQIKEEGGQLTELTSAEPIDYQAVKTLFKDEPDTVFIEYLLTDEKSYLWTITGDNINSYELPPQAEIEKASLEFHKTLIARQSRAEESTTEYQARVTKAENEIDTKACKLSEMLIPSSLSQLEKKRLIIVPDKILNYISFDALPVSCSSNNANLLESISANPLLIEKYETVMIPSVSALAILRKKEIARTPAINFISIFADPVFEASDSRLSDKPKKLPFSKQNSVGVINDNADNHYENHFSRLIFTDLEARQIVEMMPVGRTQLLSGFEANLDMIDNSKIKDSQIIHFATHSLINNEIPELSGIFLSQFNQEAEPRDGALRIREIYNLNLNAQLIILSSCNTAIGKEVSGEGLISLSRSFMTAGANSVIGSLWKVDDQATSELMKNFYMSVIYEKLTLSEALRTAKLKMLRQKKWQSPYFWSGFVLQGEYKNKIIIANDRKSPFPFMAVLLIVLTIIIIIGIKLRKLST